MDPLAPPIATTNFCIKNGYVRWLAQPGFDLKNGANDQFQRRFELNFN